MEWQGLRLALAHVGDGVQKEAEVRVLALLWCRQGECPPQARSQHLVNDGVQTVRWIRRGTGVPRSEARHDAHQCCSGGACLT